jgi:hypothetical protein
VLYVYAAKSLGMDTSILVNMREPDRTFWFNRGLMLNRAEGEAYQEDQRDREYSAWASRGAGGRVGGIGF